MKSARILSIALVLSILISAATSGFITSAGAEQSSGLSLFVSPKGNDANSGTQDAPFATLDAARDAIRAMKNAGGLPAGGVTVYLRGGEYHLESSFALEEQDSGTKDAPITYKAYGDEKPVLTGGNSIDFSKAVAVTDSEILSRLPKETSDKVVQIDLKQQSISKYGELTDFGFSLMYLVPPKQSKIHPMLFFDGNLMTQARWPNEDFAYVSNVIDGGSAVRYWREDVKLEPQYVPADKRDAVMKGPIFEYDGDRPARWTKAKDIWMYGYWYWDWADQTLQVESVDTSKKTIKAAGPSAYGIRAGQRYYAFNLLEEIDMPGEWYIDRDTGILYIYPPSANKDAKLTLCSSDFNMIQMDKVSFVNIEGITIEATKGRGIVMNNSFDNKINEVTISKVGDDAIKVEKGQNISITNSHIFSVAKGGIILTGGDRPTLTPSGCNIENNYIHHIGMIQKTFVGGISVIGVGTRVAHNEVHDSPFMGIGFDGNDNIVEFNYLHDIAIGTDDCGAMGTGRNWTYRGNEIRYNFVHNLTGVGTSARAGVRAVMLDDMTSGTKVYGNVFSTIQSAISINGGRDNEIENNIFVKTGFDGKATIYIGDWSNRPDEGHLDPQTGTFFVQLKEVPYQNELWSKKYPKLANLLNENYKEPRGNVIQKNLFIDSKPLSFGPIATQYSVVKDNVFTNDDPGFVNAAELNFALKDDSSIYSQIPGFQKIPFEKMGLLDKQKITDSVMLAVGSPYAYVSKTKKWIDPENLDVRAIVKDGRTLLPVRFIAESYGAKVDWDEKTSGITVTLGSKVIKMTLGSQKYYVDDVEKTLDIPAQTINGRTLIPLRALVEAMGKKVFWDDRGLILISDRDNVLDANADHDLIGRLIELFNLPLELPKVKNDDGGGDDEQVVFSFENAPLGFELSGAVVSEEQAKTGTKSVKINQDSANVNRKYPVALKNVVTMWIYDHANADQITVMARVDDGGSWRGMGIKASVSMDNYVIRESSDYTVPHITTSVKRTKGWHKFQWDYTNAGRVDYYIDGKKVGTTAGLDSFDSISIIDLWTEGAVSNIYVDDIGVSNSLDGSAAPQTTVQETASTPTPTPASTPAPTSAPTPSPTPIAPPVEPSAYSFEAAPLGFEMAGAEVSTEQAHTGSKSIKINADSATVSRNNPQVINKAVTMWVYDHANPSEVRIFARVDDGTQWRGIGIATATSKDYYVIRDSADYQVPFTVTKAKRTKGWHKFQWDLTTPGKVDYYIDGVKVGTTEGSISAKQIALVDFWAEGAVSNIFVDDIEMTDGI